MPIANFDRVVSCSSEDPNHPAKNLLKGETYKKWKCKSPGEDQVSIVLQLEKSTLINAVDIGNEFSAFVEVLVSRSTGNPEDFKVLLVASSFMTPVEARNGEHPNRVRMFNQAQLSKPAVDESWDRVKVVCRQPFNRHVQYGLTFLKLHTPPEKMSDEVYPKQQHQTKLGRFVIREEDTDDTDIRVGSLFAVKHGATVGGGLLGGTHKIPVSTGAAAIMDASKPAALASMQQSARKASPANITDKGSLSTKRTDTPIKDLQRPDKDKKEMHRNGFMAGHSYSDRTPDRKDFAKCSPSQKTVEKKKEKEVAETTNEAKKKEKEAVPVGSKRPSPTLEAGPSSAKKRVHAEVPFSRLLNGVTLVISGYQNPHRANLREAALEMGARYRPDWGPGCTHLICAFPNTPKFNQVKGHGKIVHKKWVEDCHSQRKRLPWRRYAMDKKDQTGPESDTEDESESLVHPNKEQHKKQEHEEPPSSPSQSDEYSDNEAIAVQTNSKETRKQRPSLFAPLAADQEKQSSSPAVNRQVRNHEQQKPDSTSPSVTVAVGNFYDEETDVDEDTNLPSDSDLPPLPHLPDLFKGAAFRLGPSLSEDSVEKLKRYIQAYNGKVAESIKDADYVVTDRIKDCEKLKFNRNKCVAVRPAWVWKCNDKKQLVPIAPFELE